MCWVFANGCLHVIACCCHLGAVMEMCRTIWAVSHLSSVGAVVDCLALLCCGKHRIYCGKKFCFLMEGYLVLGKWRFSSVTAVNLFHLCYLLLCFYVLFVMKLVVVGSSWLKLTFSQWVFNQREAALLSIYMLKNTQNPSLCKVWERCWRKPSPSYKMLTRMAQSC